MTAASLSPSVEVFAARRRRFVEAIGGAVAVLPNAPVAFRTSDAEYPYRPDSDFYYLTGLAEPHAVALFAPADPQGGFVLFVRPRDRQEEAWTGPRVGVEGALGDYGADRAYPVGELWQRLADYLSGAERVYYVFGKDASLDGRMIELLRASWAERARRGLALPAFLDPRNIVHEARLVKGPEELALMRRAAAIGAQAHRRAMAAAQAGMSEYEIEALVLHAFRSQGAAGPSYPPIVASGPSAAILHYSRNCRRMQAGELLLLDAGCEYEFYASDITRTFPVSGRFTALQRELYDLVLAAQAAAIAAIRPGAPLEAVHDAAVRVLAEGLSRLGLLPGTAAQIVESASYRAYYTHRTSHWLGMDVHDVGRYRLDGNSRRLAPGMVLTVEPGLYFAADDANVPQPLRGIGIRIEDDVAVTENGAEVLTAEAPKSAAEIEALCAGRGAR